MRDLLYLRFIGALIACAGASVVIAAAPANALGSYSPYNETPSAALARYVHMLADNPQDFHSLIGAGRAAMELGDAQAAAGFFARADEINPRSPDPQAGMGAVSVSNGDAKAALPYFKRAQQLGGRVSEYACDRGLAYDLLGQQAQAQADYRQALNGPDADEASRRLALSLAISGNRAAALEALSPLLARRDAGAARTRAFVLALTGDSSGAMAAADAAMPGSWARVSPFLQRLPTLKPAEKAAAVNLGIFPDSNGTAYASAGPLPALASISSTVTNDRLTGIEELLRAPSAPAPQPAYQGWEPQTQPATQVAYSATPQTVQRAAAAQEPRKIWLQLSSGHNPEAFPGQFEQLKRRHRELFEGIPGYVATSGDRARLVVGPFKDSGDAQIFAEDLASEQISAFQWSNSASDRIVPISAE
jgi:Flp pilus assembly protein TadD